MKAPARSSGRPRHARRYRRGEPRCWVHARRSDHVLPPGELGLEVTGQRLEPGRAVLACRVLEPGQWCRRRGCEGLVRDTVIRQLAREPPGWRPTTLAVTIRRYRCAGCSHAWRQDTTLAAGPRAKFPRRGLRRA